MSVLFQAMKEMDLRRYGSVGYIFYVAMRNTAVFEIKCIFFIR